MPETVPQIDWHRDDTSYSLNSPNQVEKACVGQYELVAFDLQCPREIGWGIYTGRDFLTLVVKGTAPDFAAAKAAAEAALRAIGEG